MSASELKFDVRFVGDQGVGITSLINRACYHQFEDDTSELWFRRPWYWSRIGGGTVTLRLDEWEEMDDDEDKSEYYYGAEAIIAVYDVHDPDLKWLQAR